MCALITKLTNTQKIMKGGEVDKLTQKRTTQDFLTRLKKKLKNILESIY
jgi:hypothetical protein